MTLQAPTNTVCQAAQDSQKLRLLLGEYDRCRSRITNLLDKAVSFFGLWITVAAGVFIVGMKDSIASVFLVGPVVSGTICFYLLNCFELIMIKGAYGAGLEQRINQIVGVDTMVWETHLAKKLCHFRFSTWAVVLSGLCLQLCFSMFSIWRVWEEYQLAIAIAHVSCLALLSGAGGLLMFRIRSLPTRSREKIEAAWPSPPVDHSTVGSMATGAVSTRTCPQLPSLST